MSALARPTSLLAAALLALAAAPAAAQTAPDSVTLKFAWPVGTEARVRYTQIIEREGTIRFVDAKDKELSVRKGKLAAATKEPDLSANTKELVVLQLPYRTAAHVQQSLKIEKKQLQDLRFAEALPKTRSGKIMRRLLKEIASGNPVTGDITTLEDLSVLVKLADAEE